MAPLRFTNQEIVAAYQRTGSVWKAAKELGCVGQSVHERLVAIGYPLFSRKWTEEEDAELRSLYSSDVPLSEIARRLGRPYGGVAGRASGFNLRKNRSRQRTDIPRNGLYTLVETRKHAKALVADPRNLVTRYARQNGLNVEAFVKAVQKHCPDDWEEYASVHSIQSEQAVCPYCQGEFWPQSGKQEYCTRKCSGNARVDRSYFGGKRRQAVGLADGVCQLCFRSVERGLTPHHIYGKENDTENDYLVAICQGCHNLVTLLGSRSLDMLTSPKSWEAMIHMALARRLGPDFMAGKVEATYVCVELEVLEHDEDDGTEKVGWS